MSFIEDFQKFLGELTTEALLTIGERLLRAPSPQERVKCVIKDDKIMKKLSDCLDRIERDKRFSKSTEKSTELRKKGNTLVQQGEIEKSLQYFSAALIHAHPGTQEYVLALVNRSVSLFLLKHYKECNEDIDLVLGKETDPDKKVQLLKRKGKSLQKLGNTAEAKKVFLEAQELLQNVSTKGRGKMTEEIEAALKSLRVSQKPDRAEGKLSLPPVSYGPNETFHSASAAVSLKSNDEKGRYVVTNRCIKKGDTLFVEKPVVFALFSDFGRDRCGHCLKVTLNDVPCLECTAICYCSNTCRQESWEQYHSMECGPGMDLCFSLGKAHLAFRLGVLSMKPSPEYRLLEGLLALTDHFSPYEITKYSLTAVLLALYLKRVSEVEASLAELGTQLFKHIARMYLNGKQITGFERGKKKYKNAYAVKQIAVAAAIYPSASMMNHSCDPNSMTCFSRTHIIVKAIRDLEEGEEVFTSYIETYQHEGYEFRQKTLLDRHNFICSCTACTSPDLKNFALTFHAFLCPDCDAPMIQSSEGGYVCGCSKKLSEKDSTSILRELVDAVDTSKLLAMTPAESLELVLETLHRAKKILYKYHPFLVQLKFIASKFYTSMGKFEESMDLIVENYEATRARYGEESVDLGFECEKFMEVHTLAMFKGYPVSRNRDHFALCCMDLVHRLLALYEPSDELFQELDR